MRRLTLFLLVGLGVLTSLPVAFLVGIALGVWNSRSKPPPEVVIRYVERER